MKDAQPCEHGERGAVRGEIGGALFFIELSRRRVRLAGVTAYLGSAWVTQQARNLAVKDRSAGTQFLIHDRDAKYSAPFDEAPTPRDDRRRWCWRGSGR
jgi:hypothetical protein